jgi:hypothetical protein
MRAITGLMTGLSLMLIAGLAQAQASNCGSVAAPKAMPVQPTVVAPIASEMVLPSHQLGAPTGVLSQTFDETQSVDQVLLRQRLDNCRNVARATPAAAPAAAAAAMPSSTDAAAYKPKTQFDNTPWRFDMNQNGKRMTAEEFDAWMKAKGVRVAKGKPGAATTAPVPAPAPTATEPKKKDK